MKKVLALVLTLAMLVGTLAVGLSAAFEFTATEDGDVFENVYSIPLGSTGSKVTYFQIDSLSDANRNLQFDIWFTSADGFLGGAATYGSTARPVVKPDCVGIYLDETDDQTDNGTERTLPYTFELNTKYTVQIRTGGAEAGKTDIIINDEPIGAVDGQIPKLGALYCGADGIILDNVQMSDGNDVQFLYDFDGTENGSGSMSGDLVTEIEVRRDLGKKYMTTGSDTGILYQLIEVLGDDGTGKVNEYSDITISFDVSFPSQQATNYVESWGSHAPSVYPNMITLGDSGTYADRPTIEYTFEYGEWYYVEFVCDGTDTDVYVDGVLAGTLNAPIRFGRDGALANNDKFWNPYVFNASVDNVAVNGYAHTFEDESTQYCIMQSGDPITATTEYVGEKVDIWEHIQTYDVEGEAVLLKAPFNDTKDPSSEENMLYMDFSYDAGTFSNYIMSFDLAIYPDKETMTTEDKTENGSWMDWIVRIGKDGSGNAQFFDDDRIKIGDKFVGKNKDLYYYGEEAEGSAVQDMTQWAAGEFHNVTLEVSNGSVTVYLDKTEVYSVPVSATQIDNLGIMYLWNCTAIIDNFYIYDAKTFEVKTTEFAVNSGSDSMATIADVKAEGAAFCEANGHINRWARTTDPKCYEMGTNTYTCWICGNEEAKQEVAMLEHDFEGYDINRVDDNGLVYIACTKSEGCTERRYIQMPAAEDYTGTINYFQDFQDDFITQLDSASWNWTIADGVSSYLDGNDLNYNQIPLEGNRKGAELNEGFKIGFDFIYNGTYETGDTPQYGNTFFLRLGQAVVGVGKIGYDAVAQQFYIGSDGNFAEIRSDVYPLVPGETYNMEIVFGPMDANLYEGNVVLYVNGVKVIDFVEDNSNPEFAGMDAYTYFAYPDDLDVNILLMYNFGVNMSIDNLVIGDNDFAWNRQYQGDVDGDYAITGSDALLMRKYLAKIDGIETLIASRADANGDGVIDAKDQLRIRKAIAAAEAEA